MKYLCRMLCKKKEIFFPKDLHGRGGEVGVPVTPLLHQFHALTTADAPGTLGVLSLSCSAPSLSGSTRAVGQSPSACFVEWQEKHESWEKSLWEGHTLAVLTIRYWFKQNCRRWNVKGAAPAVLRLLQGMPCGLVLGTVLWAVPHPLPCRKLLSASKPHILEHISLQNFI